jgi:hypothetical protein
MAIDYKQLFADVKADLQRINNKEANLENDLAAVAAERQAMETTYNAIAGLVGEDPLPTLKNATPTVGIEVLQAAGISVALRAVLDASPNEDFTAATARDRLAEMGWDWGRYTNAQATVYTTLVRLAAATPAAVKETAVYGKKAFYSANRVDRYEPDFSHLASMVLDNKQYAIASGLGVTAFADTGLLASTTVEGKFAALASAMGLTAADVAHSTYQTTVHEPAHLTSPEAEPASASAILRRRKMSPPRWDKK